MTISHPIIGTLSEQSWALIPSEPAIFHDMIKEYGVRDVRVQDLVTFDFDNIKDEKMHGLIFISKYDDETAVQMNLKEPDPDAEEIIFTAQVVTNVCGTLALLAILFNADINDKGALLDNFLQFTDGFTPVNRGMCIGNCSRLRKIHDAFGAGSLEVDKAYRRSAKSSKEDTSIGEETLEEDVEPAFHYTSFIYKNGFVWEMDGLKPGPIKIAACSSDNWVSVVEPILRERVQVLAEKYGDEYFNLLGILEDNFPEYRKRNELLASNLKKFDKMIASKAKTKANIIRRHKNEFYKNIEQTTIDYVLLKHIWDELDEGNAESILGDIETVRTLHNSLDDKIQTYESNEEVFERDAQRQKFDYFPFIRALIKIAHKKGLVEDPAIKKEKEAASKKRKKAPAKSNSAKTTEKTSKKRKSTTAKSVESEDKPAKKRKR
ncbi:unnamed protein product [Mucor hiemalis]